MRHSLRSETEILNELHYVQNYRWKAVFEDLIRKAMDMSLL